MAAKVSHRPDTATAADGRIRDKRIVLYLDTVADGRIYDPDARPYDAILADDRPSLNAHILINDGVASDRRLGADIRRGRIGETHAAFQHQPYNGSAPDHVFHRGQLPAVIYTLDLGRIVVKIYRNVFARRA